MVYPTLLPLMRTTRLPVVDRTYAPADLNGLVRFAERRNLVSARVPSHFKRSLPLHEYITSKMECRLRSTHPYNLDFSGRRMVRSALLKLYRNVRGCCEADLLCRMPGRSYASLTACVFKTMHKSLPETKPWSSRP